MLEDLKLAKRYDGFLFLAEAARNPPTLKSHRHIELELNVVVRGEITYVVEDRRFTFRRGTLLWMFPSQEHQLVSRTPDAQYYVAVFKPVLIARSCRSDAYAGLKRQDAGREGVLHAMLELQSFDLVRKTMDSLMQGSLDPDILNREAGFGVGSNFRFAHADPDGLNAGLHHLLMLCWRCRRSGKVLGRSVSLHPAISRALELLSTEDNEELTLETVARRCGVSPSYLSRVFANQIGVPLSHYRNSVRLGRFWDHYRQPVKKTITEAMLAAGFGSYAQFYKVFSQAYGRGPREGLRGA